jgi:heterodisulfide reductase subunit C
MERFPWRPINMSITITSEGKAFRDAILSTPGAERIMHCYQCGTCTNDCPVAKRVEEFRPRQIARLVMYGQEDRLMEGDLVYLCAGCYTCYEHCPQQVHVSEIISALRKYSLNNGHLLPTFKVLMKGVAETGYIYEIDEFENEMREDDDLPHAPTPDTQGVEAMMRFTGFLDKVEASKQ